MRSQGASLKGTEGSLSYVPCFLYLVSSSINVSIFSYYVAAFLLDRPHIHCEIVTAVSLTFVSIHIYKKLFLVMTTFKIYVLSNF